MSNGSTWSHLCRDAIRPPELEPQWMLCPDTNGVPQNLWEMQIPSFPCGQLSVLQIQYLVSSRGTRREPVLTLKATAVAAVVRSLASVAKQRIRCRGCSKIALYVFFLFLPMVIAPCIICRRWQTTPVLINKAAPPRLCCSLADASHGESFLNASGTSPGLGSL